MTSRWRDYVMAEGDGVRDLWSAAAAGRSTTFILGVGFDPRAMVGLEAFLDHVPGTVRLARVALPHSDTDHQAEELAQAHGEAFAELVDRFGLDVVTVSQQRDEFGRTAGQTINQVLLDREVIGTHNLVVVDVSSLPATIYLPVIAGLIKLHDRGEFAGEIQVLVCENSAIDRKIVEEGGDAGPIGGFRHGWTREVEAAPTTVWAPVIGEAQEAQLRAVHQAVSPDEICPVLPFPARDPRRADDLFLEYRQLLVGSLQIEVSNIIYAHESNPFDLYRALTRLDERYAEALAPLGSTKVVLSLHASKTLALGAMLAAYERELPVLTAGPSDYRIAPGVALPELGDQNRLVTLWLAGEPYQ